MRAIELQDGPGLANLKLVERADPRPGPGEVLVKLHAATLNYRDLLTIEGTYGVRLRTPLIPLSDGCGVVVETGEGVGRVEIGDRVCPLFFQDWLSGSRLEQPRLTALGGPLDGVAAEYICLGEHGVSKVPSFLSDAQAAALPCAGLTAWSALFVEARAKPGDVVLLQGTGGVSIFGLQLAKAAGCTVIITSSSDEKLEHATALGADHTINYVRTPEWGSAARELTDGRGVDHVLEVGGKETLAESFRALRSGRHVSLIGLLSGRAEGSIGLGANVRSIYVGNRFDFEEMCRGMETNRIEPVVDQSFKLGEIPDALRFMKEGRHFGKIAIAIGD